LKLSPSQGNALVKQFSVLWSNLSWLQRARHAEEVSAGTGSHIWRESFSSTSSGSAEELGPCLPSVACAEFFFAESAAFLLILCVPSLTFGFELSQGLMLGILYLGVSGLRALLLG